MDYKDKIKAMRAKSGVDTPDRSHMRVYPEFSGCPECHGTFYKTDGSICDCMRLHKVYNRLRKANVPRRYFDVDLQFYRTYLGDMNLIIRSGLQCEANRSTRNNRDFVKFLDGYARNFANRLKDGKSFVICGGVGCGKTGACCYIVREVLSAGYSAYYIDTNDLLDTISVWYNGGDDGASAKAKLDGLKKKDLLVLDDIGSEYAKNKSWLYTIFLDLIKSRYMNLRPTIITSNANPDKLLSGFDEDVAGRLESVLSEFQILFLQNTADVRVIKAKKDSLYKSLKEEG